MEIYLQEYEDRKMEKAHLKQINDADRRGSGGSRGAIPASSVHQDSLHGNSYHGRKIITSSMIESLDTTIDNNMMENGNNNNNTSIAQDDVAGSNINSGHEQEREV